MVLELIPKGATVGWGDSVTLHQIGVITELQKSQDYKIFDPFQRSEDGSLAVEGEERLSLMRKAMAADVFLSSMNAITIDGRMVSTDATGNRVAPVIFGPRKVIIVVGANKIVKNLKEAMSRVKNVAAPINAKRHLLEHKSQRFSDLPCVKTGNCVDCFHPERICRYTIIIDGERQPGAITDYIPRIHLIIVGKELGI